MEGVRGVWLSLPFVSLLDLGNRAAYIIRTRDTFSHLLVCLGGGAAYWDWAGLTRQVVSLKVGLWSLALKCGLEGTSFPRKEFVIWRSLPW